MNSEKREFEIKTTPAPNFGQNALLPNAVTTIMRRTGVTEEEREIGRQLRIYAAEQTAVTIRGDYGAQLSFNFTRRTYDRIDEFVYLSREIREKERHPEDQAVMEKVCDHLVESEVNTQLAFRQSVVNELGRINLEPFDYEQEGEQVVIEQRPGLLGRLLGGQTVTRVMR